MEKKITANRDLALRVFCTMHERDRQKCGITASYYGKLNINWNETDIITVLFQNRIDPRNTRDYVSPNWHHCTPRFTIG